MKISRRSVVRGIAASTASAVLGSISRSASAQISFMSLQPMPVGYVAHGSPLLLGDKVRGAELATWGASLPRPKGIVVLTPHYRSQGVELGHVGPGFGMYNLPDWIRKQTPNATYASPTNEALAQRVHDALGKNFSVGQASQRPGFDHTTWIPLFHMFPKADVPVLEIGLPFFKEMDFLKLGMALAPLRSEGILILASGTITHNLAAADLEGKSAVPAWASSFDAWSKNALQTRDVNALLDWRHHAPQAEVAHPDDGGHFRVLLVAIGAATGTNASFASARFPSEGFELGNLSKRCVELT